MLLDCALVADYSNDDTFIGGQSRDVGKLTLTGLSRQLLTPSIETNLSRAAIHCITSHHKSISKWKISSVPTQTIAENDEAFDDHRPLAILQDDRVELRFERKRLGPESIPVPLPTDVFPHWRVLSWSTDALLIAVGGSDGSIRVLHARHGGPYIPLFVIESQPVVGSDGNESSRTSPKRFDPWLGIVIIEEKLRGPSNGDKAYTHELLAFSCSGTIESFHINLNELLENEALASNNLSSVSSSALFWKRAINVSHAGKASDPVMFRYRKTLRNYLDAATALAIDLNRNSIVLAGARFSGSNEGSRFVGLPKMQIILELKFGDTLELVDAREERVVATLPEDPVSSGQPNILANALDLAWDAWSHLLSSNSQANPLVSSLSISPHAQGKVLSLDTFGNIYIYSRASGKLAKTLPSELLLTSRRSAESDYIPKPDAKVHATDARWWRNDLIVAIFSDGVACVYDISTSIECLTAESFSSCLEPSLAVIPKGKIFVLECSELEGRIHQPRLDQEDQLSRYFQPPTTSKLGLHRFISNIPVWTAHHNLVSIDEVTPEEALRIKLLQREYGTALELCEQYSLDVDEVYKAKWLDSDFDDQAINDILTRLKDREWALRNALNRSPKSSRVTRGLLKYVISQTERATLESFNAEIESFLEGEEIQRVDKEVPITTLCALRIKAFKFLDRLETFEAISKALVGLSTGTVEGFQWSFGRFRDEDIVEVAKTYAAQGNVLALEIFFLRHPEVLPFRFEILSQLPPTTDLALLKKVLPRRSESTKSEVSKPTIPWRTPDWTESTLQVAEILLEFEIAEARLFKCGLKAAKPPIEIPATSDFLTQWYTDFVKKVEAQTSLTSLSQSIVQTVQAAPFNIEGLELLSHNIRTLSDLIYICGAEFATLNDVENMPHREIIQLALSRSMETDQSCVDRLRNVVNPYAQRVWQLYDEDIFEVIDEFLLDVASKDLKIAAKAFEQSRQNIPAEDRIISPRTRLAKLILQCSYLSSNTAKDLDILNNLYRSLPSFGSPDEAYSGRMEESSENLARLHNTLSAQFEDLRAHLQALEVLSNYNILIAMDFFETAEASIENQRSILRKMSRFLIEAAPNSITDKDWTQLLKDQATLFHLQILPNSLELEAKKDFLRSALESGKFALARTLVSNGNFHLSEPDLEEIVFSIAREFLDNSSFGSDLLKAALNCLEIGPSTLRIQKEIEFVNGCFLLYSTYERLFPSTTPPLPIQIRLREDRLGIVADLIHLYPKSRNPECNVLVDIGKKLTQRRSGDIEIRVRGMIASWALDYGKIDLSLTICDEMIQISSATPNSNAVLSINEEWRVALKLIKQHRQDMSESTLRQLITFCLEWCEPQFVTEILNAGRHAEISPLNTAPNEDIDITEAIAKLRTKLVTSSVEHKGATKIASNILSVNAFYSSNLSELVPYFLEEDFARTDILVSLERLKALQIVRALDGATFDSGSGVESFDNDICELARDAFITGDSGLALCLLLELHNSLRAAEFFRDLCASKQNDIFAVYYFCRRALELLLIEDDPESASVVESQRPSHVIERAEKLAVKASKLLISDSEIADDEHVPYALLRCAHEFSSRSQSDYHEKVLSSILSRPEVDKSRFNNDESYRREALIKVSTSPFESISAFMEISLICTKLGIEASFLALERIVALLEDDLVSSASLEEQFEQLKSLLETEPSLARLKALNSTILESAARTKVVSYYRIITLLSRDQDVIRKLTDRISFILWLEDHRNNMFYEWPLLDLIGLNYTSESPTALSMRLRKSFDTSDIQSLKTLSGTLKRLSALKFVDVFESEHELSAKGQFSQILIAASSFICKSFIQTKVDDADWEYEEEERIQEDLHEIESLLSFVLPSDLMDCLTICCIGEKASSIPIDLRLNLLKALPSNNDLAFKEDYRRLSAHLALIGNLSKLEDSEGNRLYSERIQQFDLLYGEVAEEAASLCMRMVVAGASPYLIDHTCKELLAYHTGFSRRPKEELETVFETPSIYREAVRCVLGLQENQLFSNVFRKGVESPVDALDRLMKVLIVPIIVTKEAKPSSEDDGWEEDGWDEEDKEVPTTSVADDGNGEIRQNIHDVLKTFAEDANATIPPEIQLGVATLLKTYFGEDVLGVARLKSYKILCITEALWDCEVTDEGFDTPEKRSALFGKLLPLTRSSEQCIGLAQIISEWSDPSVVEDGEELRPMWKAVVRKAAVLQSYTLLILMRRSPELRDIIDVELSEFVSSELTKVDMVDSLSSLAKWQLISGNVSFDEISNTIKRFLSNLEQANADIDSFLILLLCAHGYWALLPLAYWSRIADALIRVYTTTSSEGNNETVNIATHLQHRLLYASVVTLLEKGKVSKAADIVFRILGVPSAAAAGVTTRLAALKTFLSRYPEQLEDEPAELEVLSLNPWFKVLATDPGHIMADEMGELLAVERVRKSKEDALLPFRQRIASVLRTIDLWRSG
ncbi:hypothetical protein HDU97_004822 [Phlyctochytrium planicorne]|nr:hypothetical protein HDU97_004822 [Phlyctochytrium planicorne]